MGSTDGLGVFTRGVISTSTQNVPALPTGGAVAAPAAAAATHPPRTPQASLAPDAAEGQPRPRRLFQDDGDGGDGGDDAG